VVKMSDDELRELTPEEIDALRSMFFKEISAGPTEELKLAVRPELEQLLYNNADIIAVLLVDSSGFPIDFIAKQEMKLSQEDLLVIASANIWGLFAASERESIGLNLGHVKRIITRTEQGFLFITRCGENFVLAALVRPKARLGVIMRELSLAAKNIAQKTPSYTF